MSEKVQTRHFHGILPGDELTDNEIILTRQYADELSLLGVISMIKQSKCYPRFGGRDFTMLVDRPDDGDDDEVVLFPSEAGTKTLPRTFVKADIIRKFVNPNATLVVQPNSVFGEDNMNFSNAEREKLRKGNLSPIIGRLAVTMDKIGNPKKVTIFGPSQGAVVGMAYAADPNVDPVSIAVVEAPNIVRRSKWQLMQDFKASGHDLSSIMRSNFSNHETDLAQLIEGDASSLQGKMKFVLPAILHPDTFAMMGVMNRPTLSGQIQKVLDKGGNIVHAWGDIDNVSPFAVNQCIAEHFKYTNGYEYRVLDGRTHAVTDNFAIDGALARLADKSRRK